MTQSTKSEATETLVAITQEAQRIVSEAMSQEANADELALWVAVKGVEAGKYTYDLFFQSINDADDGAAIYSVDDVKVVVPSQSIERLRGARLEWSEDDGGGLVMVNPNAPQASELAPGVPAEALAQGLEGPLALSVISVLEKDVNPSIAAHGGRSDLVAIDEEKGIAYLALSGGCQGCAMSRMTLTEGIEVALREQVPALTDIIDVTDHATGENPFYSN